MNERIRELCLQTMKEDSDEKWLTQEEFMERFAELIVRECAEIARLNTRVDSKVYLMIREHFGVD